MGVVINRRGPDLQNGNKSEFVAGGQNKHLQVSDIY